MLSLLKSLFVKNHNSRLLASILADVSNREELLGMKAPVIPTPEGIKIDAARILKYTDSEGYKTFAGEAWARVIRSLDKILDPRTSTDQRNQYCGEVNATLDLLRLSHNALEIVKHYNQEHEASSRHVQRS